MIDLIWNLSSPDGLMFAMKILWGWFDISRQSANRYVDPEHAE